MAGFSRGALVVDDAATSRSNLGLGNVENTALSTWAGSANITTLGAITSLSSINTTNLVLNSSGYLTLPKQCIFQAYKSAASANNVTGDGTSVDIVGDVETFDNNNNYNNSNGIATAPVSGKYLMSLLLKFLNVSSAHTRAVISAISTNRYFEPLTINLANLRDSNNAVGLAISTFVNLAAGDIFNWRTAVYNGTKTIGIDGGSSTTVTVVSGHLIG